MPLQRTQAGGSPLAVVWPGMTFNSRRGPIGVEDRTLLVTGHRTAGWS